MFSYIILEEKKQFWGGGVSFFSLQLPLSSTPIPTLSSSPPVFFHLKKYRQRPAFFTAPFKFWFRRLSEISTFWSVKKENVIVLSSWTNCSLVYPFLETAAQTWTFQEWGFRRDTFVRRTGRDHSEGARERVSMHKNADGAGNKVSYLWLWNSYFG